MVDVDIQPQRMEPGEHVAQFLCDAHGHEYRYTGTNTHNLNMRDLAQTSQQLFQNLWRKHQRIAAREQNVAHLWGPLEVFDLHFEFLAVERLSRVADNA